MKQRRTKTFKKAETLLVTILVSVLFTAGCLYLFTGFAGRTKAHLAWLESWLQILLGENIWSLWAAQLSLTFLSISVLSILSDKYHVIYWKDLVEERLLSPRFCCFAAYTYYSIAAAMVAFAGVITDCAGLFIASFVINVIVLILLTDSILDVYFSKEKHKKRMRKQLQAAYKQAFQVDDRARSRENYDKIMDNFTTQIQRQKTDAQYMAEVFELIYNNIALFDTDNPAVQEVMYSHFDIQYGALDLRPFEKVVETAEKWAEKVGSGETKTAYTADWLFWCAASEKWRATECFADVHSHGVNIDRLVDLERLLNRRLRALIACERYMAGCSDQEAFALPEKTCGKGWVGDRYFYLVRALFGCYVAIYGKRLDRYYKDHQAGLRPFDKNVYENFPVDKALLGQLSSVIKSYNDLQTYLHPYCPQVQERFESLIPVKNEKTEEK